MHYTIDEELSARILQFEKYIKAKKALVRQMFPYSPVLRKNFSSLLDTLLEESRRGNIDALHDLVKKWRISQLPKINRTPHLTMCQAFRALRAADIYADSLKWTITDYFFPL